jgi:Xaa-Pro aminopeptidase
MRAAKPGAWEYELEAAAEGTFRRLGAERLGYPSIVGAGFNGTTLHYDKSRSQLAADDLIVMDMGAEFGYYSADVTRTIPATGKFTARQRAIYDLVLATQQAAIDSVRPGITMSRLGQIAREYMRTHSGDLCRPGTCDRYYIHGLGHWIGMDVHDVGDYAQPLAPGMVLTIEPGIYIPEEKLGVRIEDDVLVTATGHEVLSTGAPRKADEVERAMRGK